MPRRILIVDDEVAFGRTAARALGTEAETVLELSATGALARIRAGERFDRILCDVTMPELTGPELFDAMIALAPELREGFVFISGGMSAETEARVQATGRPCVSKPLRLSELRDLAR